MNWGGHGWARRSKPNARGDARWYLLVLDTILLQPRLLGLLDHTHAADVQAS